MAKKSGGLGLTILMGMGKGKKGKPPVEEEPEDDSGELKVDAAQELLDAIKSGDAEAVATAFDALVGYCSGE